MIYPQSTSQSIGRLTALFAFCGRMKPRHHDTVIPALDLNNGKKVYKINQRKCEQEP